MKKAIEKRDIRKIRFIEPGNLPYRVSVKNLFIYDKYIRTPSTGLMTLATLVKKHIDDTRMYSESISTIHWKDVLSADIVCIGIFTFNADRGYEIARYIKEHSSALVVMGGLHATLNYQEAVNHCDYVLLSEADESIVEFIDALRKGKPIDIEGVAYKKGEETVFTGYRKPPVDIDTVPDRYLLHNYHRMAGHNTLWLQVHASRGCPHNCDYCSVVRHFGRTVRKRSPESVVEDIRQSIAFHRRKLFPRMSQFLWITDDNFFADRKWAVSVLHAIIRSGIRYKFSVQARYEVGFDDEMLELLKQAGFFEIAMGIEFLDDRSFEKFNKVCTSEDVLESIRNIQKHGLSVRGLFIAGTEDHRAGIGNALADFVISNKLNGVLIQSMYFIPGTPAYDKYKERLIYRDWSKFKGNVVHFPENISPYQLQKEIIHASLRIYSWKRLLHTLIFAAPIFKLLFIGEFFWHRSICGDYRKDLPYLKKISSPEHGRVAGV